MFWHSLLRKVSQFWNVRIEKNTGETSQGKVVAQSLYPNVKTETKLRVCMLVYSFYESDNRVLRYAETLARRGDQVDVIALRKEGQPFKSHLGGGNVYRIQKRLKNEKNRLSYLLRIINFFAKAMILLVYLHIKKRYHLVHVHNIPDFLVFAAVFPKLLGAKVILDIHDIMPELYGTKFRRDGPGFLFRALVLMEKMSCAFSNHVIVANHIWHRTLSERSVKKQKCSVVLNYPDEKIFFRRLRTRNNNKFTIIYPGSLNWHQGIDIAIKAFGNIKNEILAEFRIYGEGNYRNSLERLISNLGLEDRVFLMGSLPINKVAEEMANADLGVEPKRNNAFAGDAMSTKILEFMSLGVPVIVSDTRVHKYYFKDSGVMFFESENEEDLARRMLLLYKDAKLRNELIQNGDNFVKEYLWDKRKEEYLTVVDKVTRKKPGL
jgi:glycosyltransferase involved in cell wall biosynthesis